MKIVIIFIITLAFNISLYTRLIDNILNKENNYT